VARSTTAAEPSAPAGRLRRTPVQARSRALVTRVLDAADAIIGTDGYAALTVPRLVERAQVAVGSLYRFFPDREAVVEGVAERYMTLFLATMDDLRGKVVYLPWEELVDLVIERFAALYRGHAAYRELFLGGHLTQELRERDRQNNDELGEHLAMLLRERSEFAASPALGLTCRLAVEAADGLLRYAFTRSPQGDQVVIDELKRMLAEYVGGSADGAAGDVPAHLARTGAHRAEL
jgi:AcrR family transcriptional regulator